MSLDLKSPLAAITAALLFGLPMTSAHAADDHDCREYATAAVRQVHQMHEIRACNRGQGTRWSDDWNVHYQWCRGVSFEAIGAERDARTNWLRSCERR
jgi:hypothetical protein